MKIDYETMRRQFWEAIIFGVNWMFTLKSPDEPDFVLWALLWLSGLITIAKVGWRYLKSNLN